MVYLYSFIQTCPVNNFTIWRMNINMPVSYQYFINKHYNWSHLYSNILIHIFFFLFMHHIPLGSSNNDSPQLPAIFTPLSFWYLLSSIFLLKLVNLVSFFSFASLFVGGVSYHIATYIPTISLYGFCVNIKRKYTKH